MKKELLLGLVLTASTSVFAAATPETFTLSAAGVVWSNPAGLCIGDINNDGFLDMIATRGKIANGANEISDTGYETRMGTAAGFGGRDWDGASVWGWKKGAFPCMITTDLNNDGRLDVILNVQTTMTEKVIKVYFGTGGKFAEQINNDWVNQLPIGVFNGGSQKQKTTLFAVDYNNDGWKDVLICGDKGTSFIQLFKNTGSGLVPVENPVDGTSNFGAVRNGDCSFGDYNQDGWMDLVLTGYRDATPAVNKRELYKNNGNGTFTLQPSSVLPEGGAEKGQIFFFDIDNDGDLDIAEFGWGTARSVNLFVNNSGIFTPLSPANLVGVEDAAAGYGDFNHDGFMDLIYLGWSESNQYGAIAYNNGDNTFTVQKVDKLNVADTYLMAGDFNNDLSIDFTTSGGWPGTGGEWDGGLGYNNKTQGVNTPPSIPSNLTATQNGDVITLSWDKSTDDKTPQNAIQYNVYAKKADGSVFTLVPVDVTSGKLKVAGRLSLQNTNSYQFNIKGYETLEFGVQAVDQQMAAGGFATTTIAPVAIENNQTNAPSVVYKDGYILLDNSQEKLSYICYSVGGSILAHGVCPAHSTLSIPLVVNSMAILKLTGENGSFTYKLTY